MAHVAGASSFAVDENPKRRLCGDGEKVEAVLGRPNPRVEAQWLLLEQMTESPTTVLGDGYVVGWAKIDWRERSLA
jgi:hypothetical protein